jgi:hypothetical protein
MIGMVEPGGQEGIAILYAHHDNILLFSALLLGFLCSCNGRPCCLTDVPSGLLERLLSAYQVTVIGSSLDRAFIVMCCVKIAVKSHRANNAAQVAASHHFAIGVYVEIHSKQSCAKLSVLQSTTRKDLNR